MGSTIIDRRISFNGGELSPWTDPRLDLDKYRSGCRTLRNFRPNVYGGAFRRPGSIYLGTAKHADKLCRLERFEFSVTTTFVMEFGDLYIRFWTTGASPELVEDPDSPGDPLEVVTPWTADQVRELQFAQQNDIVYIVHPTTRPHILSRVANDNWALTAIIDEWPATLDENITTITLEVTGGDPPAVYPAWAALPPYVVGDRVSYNGQNWRCINNIPNFEIAFKPPGTWGGSVNYWTPLDMSFTFGIGQTVAIESSEDFFDVGHIGSTFVIKHRRDDPSVDLALNAAVSTLSDQLFVLGDWSCNVVVNQGGTWEVKCVVERSFDGVTWETIRAVASSGVSSGNITGTEINPCYLRMRTTKKTGSPPASGSFTLEATDSYHYGLLYVTDFVDAQEVEARVVFPPEDDPTTHWNEPAWSDYRGFPRSVCFHENRIMFGGSESKPQTVWGSVIDDYSNFRISADDDGGLAFTLAADAANGIQWMVSQESLIIGTTGSEWTVGTRDTQSALTPTSIAAKRNTTYGSDYIQARVVSDVAIFVQRASRKVREFSYSYEKDGFVAQDLTLLSEHITSGLILQFATQKNPETVLWGITGDGNLIGVVYERGQRVAGWFRFDTGGRTEDEAEVFDSYESAAIVSSSGEEDEIWVSVMRTVDGNEVRYIERFQPDIIRKLKNDEQLDLCYVDSAIITTGVDIVTVTGLDHLEGRTVAVLSNGAPESDKVVLDGEITLDFPANTVVVGLPFDSILEPTFLETNDPNSLSQAGQKRLAQVTMELWKSVGAEVTASDFRFITRAEFRSPTDFMDAPPPLLTGIFEELSVDCDSASQISVKVRQRQPLPLNVLSIISKYDLNIT